MSALPEPVPAALHSHFASGDGDEHAAALLCGVAETGWWRITLLVREVIPRATMLISYRVDSPTDN